MTQRRRQNPGYRSQDNIKVKLEEVVWAQFTSLAQNRNLYEHLVSVEVGEFVSLR
jgi:hypothetical protein